MKKKQRMYTESKYCCNFSGDKLTDEQCTSFKTFHSCYR